MLNWALGVTKQSDAHRCVFTSLSTSVAPVLTLSPGDPLVILVARTCTFWQFPSLLFSFHLHLTFTPSAAGSIGELLWSAKRVFVYVGTGCSFLLLFSFFIFIFYADLFTYFFRISAEYLCNINQSTKLLYTSVDLM